MSTARAVPITRGDLEANDAQRTLRRCGRRRLAVEREGTAGPHDWPHRR